MRMRAPITTSLSTAEPRPTALSAPTAARSRTCAWSPTNAPAPIVAPATTTAPAAIVAPSPMTVASGSRSCACDRRPSTSALPTTAPAWMRTPPPTRTPAWITTLAPSSTSSGSATPRPSRRPGARSDGCSTRGLFERSLQALEDADDAQPAGGARQRLDSLAHAIGEVAALDAQRLLGRHLRAPDVARARGVPAEGGDRLVEPLVVDHELLLERHVVERRHALRADDREAALLVRVEPRQVQVRHQPRREAQVAEDDVLDARLHVALAERVQLARLLVGQRQQDRDVVRAQRPERVLVGAQR